MPWMELNLDPQAEWNDEDLEDWVEALAAFLMEKEKGIQSHVQVLPGYHIVALGKNEELGELVISSAERIVVLLGLSLKSPIEREFALFVARFARRMGAVALRVPVASAKEKLFWKRLGGEFYPEPVPLKEKIRREKIGVEPLYHYSLLVTYRNKPVLCLEPIYCNAHAGEVISLAQRRAEKVLGGQPIGFASRISVHCPWELEKNQWDDLLALSRLEAFEVLEQLVLESVQDESLHPHENPL